MSIIPVVNGIVETYPVKAAILRNGRAESAGEREHHGQQKCIRSFAHRSFSTRYHDRCLINLEGSRAISSSRS